MKETVIEIFANHWHLSKQIIKYTISGGTAAVVELALLYIFTEFFGIWYIASFILAFMVAFVVTFCMQKFWTFQNNGTGKIRRQVGLHLITTVLGAIINTAALYVFVEYLDIWYMLSQVIIGVVLALASFIIYKFFIFKNDGPSATS